MSRNNIRILVVLLLAATLASSQDSQPSGEYTFEQFEQQFGRKYTGQQRQQHRKAFNKNYQELLSAQRKSGGNFQVQVNNFTDMTDEQKGNLLSYRPKELNLPVDNLPKFNKLKSIALPQTLNYTAQGKVTSVKNQGKCGACWAFTTAAMYQSQLLLKGLDERDLSEQYLIQCTQGASCNGGWPATALNFFTQKGIPQQADYPYKANDTYFQKDQICSSDKLIKIPYDVDSIKHYSEVPDSQLKQILLESGPVSVGVKGDKNGFLYYSGGVFSGCDDTTYDYEVNHVLLLVGWTKEGNWIVKNSWGKGWGEKGYGIISANKNCGITHFVDALTLKNVRNDQKTSGQQDVQPNQMESLRIKMSDSYGDGWNGYVMGIRQGNSIVTVFGEEFKAGTDQGPVEVQIKAGVQTSVVVAVVGTNSQEIGFSIIDSQGNQVCKRAPGSKFVDTIIFCTFCPSCESSDKVSYQLLLTDSAGDGWNGNVLSFKQDGVQSSFGEQFINGKKYGPRTVQFTKNMVVQVSPYLIGKRTQEIGFELRDTFGNIVFKRDPGTAFAADAKLGQFCPGCENLFIMNYQVDGEPRQSYVVTENYVSLTPYIIAVSVLGAVVFILAGVIIYLAVRKRRVDFMISKRDSMQSIPHGGSILVSTATIPDEIQSSGTVPSSHEFKLN